MTTIYPGRFDLAVLSSTESLGFDVMKKMDQIEEANVGIAIATARPVKCVFNTMPQALFHRASIDDDEMVHFLPQKSRSIFEDPEAPKYEYRLFGWQVGSRAGRSAKIKHAGYKYGMAQ